MKQVFRLSSHHELVSHDQMRALMDSLYGESVNFAPKYFEYPHLDNMAERKKIESLEEFAPRTRL